MSASTHVRQQSLNILLRETHVLAPGAGIGGGSPTHDSNGATTVCAQQHNGTSPDVFLSHIPVASRCSKALPTEEVG